MLSSYPSSIGDTDVTTNATSAPRFEGLRKSFGASAIETETRASKVKYLQPTGSDTADETRSVSSQPILSGEPSSPLLTTGTSIEQVVDSPSIYFRSEPISDELRRAVQLLESSRTFISDAIRLLEDGEPLRSDELTMEFKHKLPELYCLRTISESFGIVINAIGNAMENRRGAALDKSELHALNDILSSLLREPAMTFERAVRVVMDFEDAGFVVESHVTTAFLDLVEIFGEEFRQEFAGINAEV